MSKEQPQQQFSIFAFFIGNLVGMIIILCGWQWIHNKAIISNLKKTAIYQEVIYVGNNTFIQCVNGCGTLWIEYIFSDSYPKTNQTIYPAEITHLNGEKVL